MAFADAPIPRSERPALTLEDRCLYIYTSGTTGLPKAANINHYRVLCRRCSPSPAVIEATEQRPHLRLPADVPHLRRRARDRRRADGRRLGLHPREVLGEPVLGRRRRPRLHAASSISASSAATSSTRRRTRRSASTSIRLCCGNGLRPDIWQRLQGALRHPAYPRVLCGDRGQRDPLQLRRHARRGRPHPALGASRSSRSPVSASTSSARQPVRGEDGLCIECDARRGRRAHLADRRSTR